MGRAAEQDLLLQLLAPPQPGLSGGADEAVVTLSALAGLGGIGKSALARAVAQSAAARGWFPGGVAWVDLHGFDPDASAQIRASQLWSALLTALGVDEDRVPVAEAARATTYHALLDRLAAEGRRVLLVFDNVAAANQVAPLLPLPGSIATRHRILLTSRLTLAELPARLVNLDVLDSAAALELLTRTLTVRRADDYRIKDDADGSLRLVSLCAGLPLAIVIVGAILAAEPNLSVAGLADELEDAGGRLAGLTYGPNLAVNTAFEVSYQRLDAAQRTVFTRFSAVPGPDAALPMIAAVAGLSLQQTQASVRDLERAHLLEPVLSVRRWRMHDLVRLYARAQLPEQAAAGASEAALGLYLFTTDIAWKRFAKNLTVPGGEVFPTPLAALKWVLDERVGLVEIVSRPDERLALQRVRLAADLAPFLQRAHLVDDVVQVADAAVRLAADSQVPELDRAVADGNLGMAFVLAGRYAEAVPTLYRAGALMQSAGDVHSEAITRMNLGVVLAQLGRYAEAQAVLDDLWTTFHDLDDIGAEATALLNMGNALLGQNLLDEALAKVQSARRLFEDLEDPHGCGQAWATTGSIHRKRGELQEAVNSYRRACAALKDSGDQVSEARAHDDLGDVLAASDQAVEARTAYMQSADIFTAVNDYDNAARVRAKAAALAL